MSNNLSRGKKGLIIGLANDKSIAYGIAEALYNAGAELGFTFVNEQLEKRVRPIAEKFGSKSAFKLDVGNAQDMANLTNNVKQTLGGIDFVVHSIAFAPKEALKGSIVDTTQEAFNVSMNVSCFSLLSITKELLPILNENASILTLSYLGAERVVPNYNIMGVAKAALEATVKYMAADLGPKGIRVNSISAGPIKTLAASGIGDFRYIFNWNKANAPLKRNTTIEEIGNSALYLLSNLASGVTGEILHVDSGYNITAMATVEENVEGKITLAFNNLDY